MQSEVNAGTISSLHQSALSTALTDIDTAIQQSRSSDASSSTESSPEEMKSKIDDLIANEVSNGTLTSDQAAELKGVFQSAFANCVGGPGGRSWPSPSDDSSSLKLLDGLNQQHLERQHNRRDPPANQGAPAIDVIVDVVL